MLNFVFVYVFFSFVITPDYQLPLVVFVLNKDPAVMRALLIL